MTELRAQVAEVSRANNFEPVGFLGHQPLHGGGDFADPLDQVEPNEKLIRESLIC